MFRLPNSSPTFQRFHSFSSFVFKKGSSLNSDKHQTFKTTRASKGSLDTPVLKQQRQIRRPKSSLARQSYFRTHSKQQLKSKNKTDQTLIGEQLLFSPCNKKFKYYVQNLDANNINQKVNHTNFLLQPCRVSSIDMRKKKQNNQMVNCLSKLSQSQFSKYQSPYTYKRNMFMVQNKNSTLRRTNFVRKGVKSNSVKKQLQIEPWQAKQQFTDSIKLNAKISEN